MGLNEREERKKREGKKEMKSKLVIKPQNIGVEGGKAWD